MSNAVSGTAVSAFTENMRGCLHDGATIDGPLERFAVDEWRPEIAIGVTTRDELGSVLREAHRTKLAVIPRGGGSAMHLGNVPVAYDAAISLAGLRGIIAYEPGDLTVTVEAGLPLAELQDVLATARQFLPLDPPNASAATVGGLLAVNGFGPLRHAFGTARDWVLGTRVVRADGTSTKSGGRVVKNVTGYDLHKLDIGALGSLGIICEATFKVAPLPAVDRSVAVFLGSVRDAAALVHQAQNGGLAMHAAELLCPAASLAVLGQHCPCALLRLAGGAAAVERSLHEVRSLASGYGGEIDERLSDVTWKTWRHAFLPQELSLRISVLPSEVGDVASAIAESFASEDARLSATVSAGLMRVNAALTNEADAGALLGRIRGSVARRAESVIVDAAPVSVKREIDVFGAPRADFGIMSRLKDEFDPERILSPGRFVGRL